ncbi:MAG TPA: phage major tail tube protein [Pseudorhodoferax sp.]|nr:phage major tail tube protein [Pseudorhodoferax sp.]
MEMANLFCGDHDPQKSKHLTLEELKLPDLQEETTDHTPGGGIGSIDIAVGGISKLEPTFKLKGWDPLLMREFGIGTSTAKRFTAYGVIRDKKTGRQFEAKAVLEGRLSRIAPDAFTRGDAMGHEYGISEVYHYELFFDGAEEVYFDLWTNTVRIGGEDRFATANRILRIGE